MNLMMPTISIAPLAAVPLMHVTRACCFCQRLHADHVQCLGSGTDDVSRRPSLLAVCYTRRTVINKVVVFDYE